MPGRLPSDELFDPRPETRPPTLREKAGEMLRQYRAELQSKAERDNATLRKYAESAKQTAETIGKPYKEAGKEIVYTTTHPQFQYAIGRESINVVVPGSSLARGVYNVGEGIGAKARAAREARAEAETLVSVPVVKREPLTPPEPEQAALPAFTNTAAPLQEVYRHQERGRNPPIEPGANKSDNYVEMTPDEQYRTYLVESTEKK